MPIYGLLHFANNRDIKNRMRLQPYIRPINELVALAMMVIRSHCANQPSGFACCIEPMGSETSSVPVLPVFISCVCCAIARVKAFYFY